MIFWTLFLLVALIFGLTVFFGAPYVPSQRRFVKQAFVSLYPLKNSDVLVDIGCGDGLVLREAALQGAKAIGYEINPILYIVARILSRKEEQVEIRLANFWMTQLPEETTVVYAFSVKRDNAKLELRMQQEANRLHRPLTLLCFGSPMTSRQPEQSENAYFRYVFHPMQKKTLTV
jgi:hypothetical protein